MEINDSVSQYVVSNLPITFKDSGQHETFINAFSANYQKLLAKYDAAETTPTNVKHWSRTDSLSANAAATPRIRKILRDRSRYEIANNSYASGLLLTLTNDMIGTGPKLQLIMEESQMSRYIEDSFYSWCCEVGLTDHLKLLKMCYERDGEGFAIMATNPRLEHKVKLDLKSVEADQCTTPGLDPFSDNKIDGIIYDDFDDPISYDMLKHHPGDMGYGLQNQFGEYVTYPAEQVLHYFNPVRPGQLRGIPPGISTLELYAQLRRATGALLRAFEIASMVAGVMETNNPITDDAGVVQTLDIGESLPLQQGMLMALPAGYKMGQFKSDQPVTSYKMFKEEILCEIGRCRNVPFNVVACRSDGYNYASGRLDFQIYYRSLRIEQFLMGLKIMDRIFKQWAHEASEVDPRFWGINIASIPRLWFWDGTEHVDPLKEAEAQVVKLNNNLTTLQIEWSKSANGNDWERMVEQRAKEKRKLASIGVDESIENKTSGISNQSSAQDTALNGAQVTSAVDIVTKVAMNELPAQTGISMLMNFFHLSKENAESMINPTIKESDQLPDYML